MSETMTRKMGMGMIFALIMSVFLTFLAPIQSHATGATPSKGNDIHGISFNMSKGQLKIGGNTNFTDGNSDKAWKNVFDKYRNFIVGISGIGAISMIVFFILQFMKLGASAGNPQARSQALAGVLWTGLAAAGLGAVTIIAGFFYNSVG